MVKNKIYFPCIAQKTIVYSNHNHKEVNECQEKRNRYYSNGNARSAVTFGSRVLPESRRSAPAVRVAIGIRRRQMDKPLTSVEIADFIRICAQSQCAECPINLTDGIDCENWKEHPDEIRAILESIKAAEQSKAFADPESAHADERRHEERLAREADSRSEGE